VTVAYRDAQCGIFADPELDNSLKRYLSIMQQTAPVTTICGSGMFIE